MKGHSGEGGAPGSAADVPVTAYSDGERSEVHNLIAVEEPLEVFINNTLFYTTMRTPGEEIFLALGYCFTRGVIDSIDDVLSLAYCREGTGNRIDLFLPSDKEGKSRVVTPRTFTAYSSCGICGSDIVRDMSTLLPKKETTLFIGAGKILLFHRTLESRQDVFHATGGAQAAGIFDPTGNLLAFSEDVGRHNALDKAIGRLVAERKLDEPSVVVLTSRLSYEMVQKVTRINAEVLIGVSSATSLAVSLARTVNLTLVGFSRKEKGIIYTCPERILPNHS